MIRHAIAGSALLAGVVSATTCHAAGGERTFAARAMAKLRAAGSETEYRHDVGDPLVIQMKYEGKWGEAQINLHRIYHYCLQASPEDCEASLDNLAAKATTKIPQPTRASLRVVVRNSEFVGHLVDNRPADIRPPHRRIGDDLFAVLAFSHPNAVGFATPEQLRTLQIDEDAAWQLASAQTRAILPEIPRDVDLTKHVVGFEEYDFLPSLLADLDAWREIARETGPDLFATAISDRSVWIGAMPDGPAFEKLRQAARGDCEAEERCISPNVYRFRDGMWVIAR